MTGAGHFDPVPASPAAKPVPLPQWRPLLPVPADAPSPVTRHPKLGEPAGEWRYHDRKRRLLGMVCRWDLGGGGKEIRSLIFAEHEKWGRQWRWLGFPRPRPLYGLDRLAQRPNAPVVIVEGEPAADAAAALLPDHIVVTSAGGAKSGKLADWGGLAGRDVVIWPDRDEAGHAYAGDVATMLAILSPAPQIAVVTPPAGAADGWDAKDALGAGWDSPRARALIAAASPATGDEEAAARPIKKSARDWLLEIIENDAELWHDRERVAHATVTIDGHRENYEIASRSFRGWLSWAAYQASGASPASEALEAALRVAETLGINRGACHPTWRRVAEHEGRIYLDLGCPQWRAVEIGATGWLLVETAPCKFLRSRGMAPLPEPETGEFSERLLREFVHVASEADFRLILAWLLAGLRPSGPYPVLVISGEQGSAKSSLMRVCRLLVDPNTAPIRSAPKDERDLVISVSNSHMLAYDNLSNIPAWLSDALCRVSSGAGFATRALHTNSEEILFCAARPLAMNGIPDLAARPDLAERSITIDLPRMPDHLRREERELWAEFEKVRPEILGALLSALSTGLRRLPGIKLERKPRMADFATFIEACAPGLGWEPGEFLRDYEENRSDAVAAAADAAPLLPVIEALLGRTSLSVDGFDGTATDLLAKLSEVCTETQRRARWFPATASQIGSALRRLAPLLRPRGIEFEAKRARDRKRSRRLILRCISEAVFEELRARAMGQSATEHPHSPSQSTDAEP